MKYKVQVISTIINYYIIMNIYAQEMLTFKWGKALPYIESNKPVRESTPFPSNVNHGGAVDIKNIFITFIIHVLHNTGIPRCPSREVSTLISIIKHLHLCSFSVLEALP